MKANELKIGNYLQKDGIVVKIDGRSIFDIWSDSNKSDSIKYKPIPITDEWLRKLGFEIMRSGLWVHAVKDLLEFEKMFFETCLYIRLGNKHVSVRYIHELQNLYRAVTGKELEHESKN